MSRSLRSSRAWAPVTWGAAALYFAGLFDRGWIPHDEGTLGQTAWRILLGEVPHRDFDALYTGLLGYLNAGAMALLGTHLLAPRIVLLLAFLVWVVAVWSIVSRFAEPPLAAAATLLCVSIGPAVYPAAMPSWYSLFLATGGLWALLGWTDEGRSRWLVAAGAFAGVSVLFKVTGLYLLAAALFAVLHVEVVRERERAVPSRGGSLLVTLPLATLVVMVVALVRSQLGRAPTLAHYVVPTLAVAAVAARQIWAPAALSPDVPRRVLRAWVLIVAAFVVPVAAYAAAFAAAGAAGSLFHGVFVLPTRRFVTAAGTHLPLHMTVGILVPLAALSLAPRLQPGRRKWLVAAVGIAGVALLALSGRSPVYRGVWFSLQVLVPVAVCAGSWAAYQLAARRRNPQVAATLLPVLWAAALTSLLQFPLAGPIYFAHVAPMGVMAAVAAASALRQLDAAAPNPSGAAQVGRRPVLVAITAFYVAFLAMGPDRGGHFGPPSREPPVRLALERGHIRVGAAAAEEYARLVAALRELSRSEWIYVTPDAPEVYFLSGFRNPTRTLFEIFDEPGAADRVPELLDRLGVNVVVLNTAPEFSPLPAALGERLESSYPQAARFGRFVVRWR